MLRRAILTSLTSAILVALPAAGAPDAGDLLDGLTSDTWRVRQAASDRLLTDPGVTLAMLARLEAAADSAEARARIDQALHHRILEQVRKARSAPGDIGSLGVQHRGVENAALLPGRLKAGGAGGGRGGANNPAQLQPGDTRPAVLVMSVLPGFPAVGRLHPGDLIVGFNGLPVPAARGDQQRFSQMIQHRRMGEAVTLDVLRGGQPVRVELELASYPALDAIYNQRGAGPMRAGSPLNRGIAGVRAALRADPDADPFAEHPELLEVPEELEGIDGGPVPPPPPPPPAPPAPPAPVKRP